MNTIKSIFCCLVLLMSACANNGQSISGANNQEIITESDEAEHRRRARIRFELAFGYFEQQKFNIALDEVKQSLIADPSFGPAYNLRGLIYAQMNEPRVAEDSFRRAISINAKDIDASHNLGWLLCQEKRFTEAQKIFDGIVGAGINSLANAKTWLTKGLCYARAGELNESATSLLRAYELDSINPIAAYNLSLVFYKLNYYDKAKFYINRLNEGQYVNSESIWLQIKIENKLNQNFEVKRLGKRLTENFSNSKESSFYLRGKFDE